MNEKIKELAVQAKIQMVSEPRLQEFAELIIDECIDAITKSNKHQAKTTYDLSMVEATIEHCVASVKDRFQ